MSDEFNLNGLQELIEYIIEKTGYPRRIVVDVLKWERRYFLEELKDLYSEEPYNG